MLLKVIILSLVAAVLAMDKADETCKPFFDQYCDQKPSLADPNLRSCNPHYGAVGKRASQLRKYIKEHVGNSFEYLLQWANFNNYKKDRAGFAKLYRHLSDQTWEDAIKLTKYLGKRGVELDFDDLLYSTTVQTYGAVPIGKAKAETEISSLAKVLDLHKQLAISGNELHQLAVKHDSAVINLSGTVVNRQHDVELANFIEEEFSEKHAQTVRNLAGHSSDLQRLLLESKNVKEIEPSGLYVHLFDEYLSKIY